MKHLIFALATISSLSTFAMQSPTPDSILPFIIVATAVQLSSESAARETQSTKKQNYQQTKKTSKPNKTLPKNNNHHKRINQPPKKK